MTRHQRQLRKRRGRPRARNKLMLAFAVLLLTAMVVLLSVVGYIAAIASTAGDITEMKPIDKGTSSVIFAADGSRLGYVQSDEIRTPIDWKDMPPFMRQATIAIEDERFYDHGGVDFQSIVRAATKNISSGKTVQGGSTITQQLVRAVYIKDPKRDFKRKIREAKLASELEQNRSKSWILHEYLNSVPYGTVGGRTAIGVEAAAVTYFSKPASKLSLTQAAMIAGLPQAPSQYNPFRNPTAALERRNEVLERMAKNGFITPAQAERAATAGLGLKRSTQYTTRREPYFFDFVQERLIEKYGVGVYRKGGLKIHTTIDPKLQNASRQAIKAQLPLKTDPSSAVVSIDPANGYIRAMASSGTYNDRSFNLAAQGRRQPGSAFKTMVLATAIRQGVDPNSTTYVSKPLNMIVPGFGPWKVETYDKTYGGQMNLVEATLKSDNSVYAQLDVDLGPKKVAETARMLGIRTKLDGLPAEGLGGLRLGVSPLEMANAYATLAAGGMYSEPEAIRRVEFPDGKKDELGKPKRKRVLTDGQAYEVTKILQRNVQSGTGTRANIGCPAAGKTGTTDNFNDAWFVGYTPSLSTSVWVGYPNALKEMRSVHGVSVAGGTFPAAIWGSYMRVAKKDCRSFPPPSTPANFSPFYSKNSSTGRRSSSGRYRAPSPSGGGGNSAGGGGYRGYDPRLYAEPPQQAPSTSPPKPTKPPQGGNGNGGSGGGNGVDGGGGNAPQQ